METGAYLSYEVVFSHDEIQMAKQGKLAASEAETAALKDRRERLLKGREKAEELGAQANTYIREKPLATISLAFAAGFVLSQLLSRK